jgi:hypothetical protein
LKIFEEIRKGKDEGTKGRKEGEGSKQRRVKGPQEKG